MNDSLAHFVTHYKQRLTNSLIEYSQQQREKIYKNFMLIVQEYKFHNYKAITFICVSLLTVFILKLNMFSFDMETKKIISFVAWLFTAIMSVDLATNYISYLFNKGKYYTYFGYTDNPAIIEHLVSDFLNKNNDNEINQQFSKFFQWDKFNCKLTEEELSYLLSIPLNNHQKQYLYNIMSTKGIQLSDLEKLQAMNTKDISKKNHLRLVKS